MINQMFISSLNELNVNKLEISQAIASQKGGLEHRRTGLSYRLFLAESDSRWYPTKRVSASDNLPKKRKNIYRSRMDIQNVSIHYFRDALKLNSFNYYTSRMKPVIYSYQNLYYYRGLRFIRGLFIRIFGIERLRRVKRLITK